eukprot:TRINITY_DN1665_c0_g1_i14.p2 TRINITY_DN1665_c0_g1~~TRINITY_DN1665_c0_g1_i14.p2  ORF type:complete len:121 (-),score=7.83 TRINITY_DN1665_c0_g1_i14:259-621(-)
MHANKYEEHRAGGTEGLTTSWREIQHMHGYYVARTKEAKIKGRMEAQGSSGRSVAGATPQTFQCNWRITSTCKQRDGTCRISIVHTPLSSHVSKFAPKSLTAGEKSASTVVPTRNLLSYI